MWNIKNGKNFYLIFSVMGLLVSLSVCIFMFFQFDNLLKDNYYGTLKSVVTTIEKQIPALHNVERLKQGYKRDEDWFWDTAQNLNSLAVSFNLAYIYVIEKVNGEYIFRISSAVSREYHPEWLDGPVWGNSDSPPEVDQAWETQKLTVSPKPFVDEWGTLVSAYLPIVTNGKTVALLGADYNIRYVKSLENRILIFLIIAFLLSAILTCALAYVGSRSVLITIEEREKTTREAVERQMEIEKLMNALKKSSEARTAFLADISSSMADPINHIIRLSSMLSKYTEITEDYKKNMDTINNEGMNLYTVINDILDILKIESGKLKYNPVKYNLPKFINDITTSYLIYTEDKPLQYKLIVDDKLHENLIGDELRIKQICHHLLANAFKYTNTGSITINITSKLKNDYVLLIIKIIDTGVGMTENKIHNIFTNYGRGSGKLGLFLCKQLAEIMKGTLTATSEQGKGSVFTLSVPQRIVSDVTIGPETAKKLADFKE